MNDQHYTIKQVATLTGLSAYTLRFYEQVGLIGPVARASNGHRQYAEHDLDRIRFLMRLRETGMPLKTMVNFVALYQLEDCAGVSQQYQILSAHREKVQAQMDALCETLAYIDYKLMLYTSKVAELRDEPPAPGGEVCVNMFDHSTEIEGTTHE